MFAGFNFCTWLVLKGMASPMSANTGAGHYRKDIRRYRGQIFLLHIWRRHHRSETTGSPCPRHPIRLRFPWIELYSGQLDADGLHKHRNLLILSRLRMHQISSISLTPSLGRRVAGDLFMGTAEMRSQALVEK